MGWWALGKAYQEQNLPIEAPVKTPAKSVETQPGKDTVTVEVETREQRTKRLVREVKKCILANSRGMAAVYEEGIRSCLKETDATDTDFELVVSELEDQGFLLPQPHRGAERWWIVKPPSL